MTSTTEKKYKKHLTTESIISSFSTKLVSLALYYSGTVERMRCRAVRRGAIPWRILRYKRILNPEEQPYPPMPYDFVRPKTFEAHMYYLAKNALVISLEELIKRIETHATIPYNTVCVTLDNGWADHYMYAAPILLKYKIPATMFLPTAFLDTMNLFWPDKVTAALLILEGAGVEFPTLPALKDSLTSEEKEPKGSLGHSMARIHHLVKTLKDSSLEDRMLVMQVLGHAIDEIGGIPMERQFLSWKEVLELQAAGIHFGSNGHGYRSFRETSGGDLTQDITTSYKILEQQGVDAVRIFSYPDGIISKEGRRILYKHGIRYSLGIGDYPAPKLGSKTTAVLGRVSVNESVAYSQDVFACRLWGIKAFGRKY